MKSASRRNCLLSFLKTGLMKNTIPLSDLRQAESSEVNEMAKNRKTIVSVTFIVALLLCAIICGACAAGKTEPEENTSVPEQTTGAKKDDTAPEATASSTEEQAISVSYPGRLSV